MDTISVVKTLPLIRLVLPAGTIQSNVNVPLPNTAHESRTVSPYADVDEDGDTITVKEMLLCKGYYLLIRSLTCLSFG